MIVLGLLLAVALPNFFGASNSAKDSASKQYLTIAYHDLKSAQATNEGVFPGSASLVSYAASAEPQLSFSLAAVSSITNAQPQKTVYIERTGANGLKLAAVSASGSVCILTADATTQYAPVISGCSGSGGSVVAIDAPVSSGGGPLLSGRAQNGQTLSATSGSWSGSPSFAYQWQRSADSGSTWTSATGSGATAPAYTVASSDDGSILRVNVTATNTGGSASVPSTASVVVPYVATALVSTDYHNCVLLQGGSVQCWGNNGQGQLGDGTTTQRNSPVAVSGITNATAVAVGGFHSCAILADTTVSCWGHNANYELGDGTTTQHSTPVQVPGLSGVTALSLGYYYSCALLSAGTVKCWGDNPSGELGDGTFTNRPTPVAVSTITGVTAISASYNHTCALLAGGAVWCWGHNTEGSVGDGTTSNRSTPVQVSGPLTGVSSVSGGGDHTCARISSSSTIKCWGWNPYGQLGVPTSTGYSATPVAATGLTTATSVSSGYYYSCALLLGGTVSCWGNNGSGQLGIPTSTAYSSTPVAIGDLSAVSVLATGGQHVCVLQVDGTVSCWGNNAEGELGDGTTTQRTTPGAVIGFASVYSAAVAADSPAAYWKLDESSGTVAADSAGGSTGTYTNAPTLNQAAATVTGSAVSFNGSNQYVATPLLNTTATATSEAWIKTTSSVGASIIGGGCYDLSTDAAGTVNFDVDNTANARTFVHSSAVVNDGAWHHVVGTFDGTTVKIYVDGQLSGSQPFVGAPWTVMPYTVTLGGFVPWGSYFNGTIDNVAYYTHALSAASVLAHYNAR